MDLSDKAALRAAIDSIKSRTGVVVDPALTASYLAGRQVGLVYYDKIADVSATIPAIIRMLVVAESYLAQPNVAAFYDIFRAARYVPFTRFIAAALDAIVAKTTGYEPRIVHLAKAIDFDDFEAVLYELVTAARYAEHPDFKGVEFIAESQTPGPDFLARLGQRNIVIECKKFDRMTDASPRMREAVRNATNPLIHGLSSQRLSAVVEWKISGVPPFDAERLLDDVLESIHSGGAIITPEGTVAARRVVPLELRESFQLTPSPGYWWDQYEYATEGPWHGVVDAFLAKMAGPSFIDSLSWVAGVKWAIVNEDALWREKRLGYTRLFKGLEQLEAHGGDCVLHVCYERSPGVGPRQAELERFVAEAKGKRKRFSWLVFNELVPHVTRSGRWDIQEHAHYIAGSTRFGAEPPVTMVFVPGDGVAAPRDRFGIGADLPPLD
jgi:hypothetical protein